MAAIHSVCAHYLPPILPQFCADYPETQLRVTALGSDRALKVLRDGLIDIAIVMNNRFLTNSAEIEVIPLYEEKIAVLMAAEHPLTAYEQITLEKLAKYPQVVFKDGYGMQRFVQDWFTRQNLELKTVMELNTLDAFRGVVRQGNMLALLPQGALIGSHEDPTLAIRPIATFGEFPQPRSEDSDSHDHLTRQVVMVTTCDRLQIPPINHFCNLVKNTIKEQVIKNPYPSSPTPL